MWKRGIKLLRVTEKGAQNHNDAIAVEKELQLYLNGQPVKSFFTVGKHEEELAVGYLAAKQIIRSIHDVDSIEKDGASVHVTTFSQADSEISAPLPDLTMALSVSPHTIFRLTGYFQEKAFLYKDTSVTHSAAIAEGETILYFAEDLKSSYAYYKVTGMALMNGTDLSRAILVTTGVMNKKLVSQSLRLGIPIIVSRFAPTDKGFDMAESRHMTLVGFARGRQFNLYTCPERIRRTD